MATNRLKLDWSLNTNIERNDFVQDYLNNINFIPDGDELETIANYILWGKDSDGLSASQKGEIEIETKNKTWVKDRVESLDAMMESPTFNEASLQCHHVPSKAAALKFSRSRALQECPESLRQTFIQLFSQIDRLDLCINYYDLAHGKRKNPPREELLEKFTEEEQLEMRERTTHWNQFFYLKQRHLLVELRREQFTLRDSYAQPAIRQTIPEPISEEEKIEFDAEVEVFPMGVKNKNRIGELVFRPMDQLNPKSFGEEELKLISSWIWKKKDERARASLVFDFCDLENVYELFQELSEMEEECESEGAIGNIGALIDTLYYYIDFADLTEVQKFILDLKIKRKRNQDIAAVVNVNFGKSYTANYISTIFRQKIIPKINEAAYYHSVIIENLFFEEEFKKCTACGEYLLREPQFFVRKARAKDGLANRCKRCDKKERDGKKIKEKENV